MERVRKEREREQARREEEAAHTELASQAAKVGPKVSKRKLGRNENKDRISVLTFKTKSIDVNANEKPEKSKRPALKLVSIPKPVDSCGPPVNKSELITSKEVCCVGLQANVGGDLGGRLRGRSSLRNFNSFPKIAIARKQNYVS